MVITVDHIIVGLFLGHHDDFRLQLLQNFELWAVGENFPAMSVYFVTWQISQNNLVFFALWKKYD